MNEPRRIAASTFAKLNLGLEVLGRRSDGYHEIVTIMQTISLCDHVTWRAPNQPFSCIGPSHVPRNRDLFRNVLESAPDLARCCGTVELDKRIPISAGLGGGSADAALALRLAYPNASEAELEAMALRLGSDVPFLIRGGTALATGRGDRLQHLSTPKLWFVIVTPKIWIPGKTPRMYQGLEYKDFSDGASVRRVALQLDSGVDIDAALPNAFERQLKQFDEVRRALELMHDVSGFPVNISGAGPSLYIILTNESDALSLASRLSARGLEPFVAETVAANYGLIQIQRLAAAMRGYPEE